MEHLILYDCLHTPDITQHFYSNMCWQCTEIKIGLWQAKEKTFNKTNESLEIMRKGILDFCHLNEDEIFL